MSTRITLWYSEDLHLYQDGFDDENVYLEIRSQYFDALVVKIPLSAWKEMRQHTIQPAERFMDMTDEELLLEAEREVDEHRARLAAQPDSKLNGLFGIFTFGSAESTRDEMVRNFLRAYRPLLADSLTSSSGSDD